MSYIPPNANGIALPSASGPVVESAINITGTAQTAPTTNYEFLTNSTSGWYDALAYSWVSFTIATTAGVSAGALTFECTNDPTNAPAGYTIVLSDVVSVGASKISTVALSASTIRQFEGPITARYIRVRVSTDVVGSTVTLSATLRQAVTPMNVPSITTTSLPTSGGNTIGNIGLDTSTATIGVMNTLPSVLFTDATGTISVTTTSSVISINATPAAHGFNLYVSSAGGSSQTLDVVIQESYDGTAFTDLYHLERITTTNTYTTTPLIRVNGAYLRYQLIVGGSGPSFTYTLSRVSKPMSGRNMRQYINHTLDPTTLSSVTSSYLTHNTSLLVVTFYSVSGTTACTLAIQGSDDGVVWYSIGSLSTSTAGITSVSLTTSGKWARAQVSTAGSSQILGYVEFTALGF